MKAPLSNQKGQALAEAALSLPLLVIAFSAMLILTYRGALYYFADHQAHEAIICLDDDSVQNCRGRYERSFKKVIFLGLRYKVKLSRNSQQGQAFFEVDLKPPLKIEKSISFPLTKNL